MGGKRPFALLEQRDWILARIKERPDLPLRDLLAEVRQRHGGARYYALWNIVKRADLSFKKTSSDRRSAYGGRNGPRYPEPEGSGRRVFGGFDPVKKRGPWAVADLRVVTLSSDPD
jgi:hypothetical protein